MKSIHYFCKPINKSLSSKKLSWGHCILSQHQSLVFLTKTFGYHGNQGANTCLGFQKHKKTLLKRAGGVGGGVGEEMMQAQGCKKFYCVVFQGVSAAGRQWGRKKNKMILSLTIQLGLKL